MSDACTLTADEKRHLDAMKSEAAGHNETANRVEESLSVPIRLVALKFVRL